MPLCSEAEVQTYLQSAGVAMTDAALAVVSLVRPVVEAEIKRILGSNLEQATYTEYYPEAESVSYLDGEQLVVGYDYTSAGGILLPRQRADRALSTVRLRELPVRSITSVYENPSAWGTAGGLWPESCLLPPNAYHIDSFNGSYSLTGKLFRTYGLWSSAPRTIKVTYVAGYTNTEMMAKFPGAKMAALEAIAYEVVASVARAKMVANGGQIGSVSIEGFSVSYNPGAGAGAFAGEGYTLPPSATARLAPYINISRYFGI